MLSRILTSTVNPRFARPLGAVLTVIAIGVLARSL